MTTPRPSLEALIDEAALLPPGPEAWGPIFQHYPELTPAELAAKFRERAQHHHEEADELRAYLTDRRGV
jgi:hypothetical protein